MKRISLNMQKNDERINIVIMYAILLSMLVSFRDLAGLAISKSIITIFCSLFMVFSSKEQLIYIIVFTIPFLSGLPGTYIMLIALLLYLIKQKNINVLATTVFFCLILLELFSLMFVDNNCLINSIQYLVFIGHLLYLSTENDKNIDNTLCLRFFNTATIIVCSLITVMAMKTAPDNWKVLFSNGWFRVGDTQMEEATGMVLALNANSMAYFCIVGIADALLLLNKSKGRFRAIYLLEIVAFIGFAVMTNSRSFIIVLLLVLVLYSLSQSTSLKSIILTVIAFLICGLIVWNFLGNNQFLIEGILGRLNDSTMHSAGGRTSLFIEYLTLWSSNIRTVFFGAGVSGYSEVFQLKGSIHNGTMQILICTGCFGAAMLYLMIVRPIYRAKVLKVRLQYYLPIISVIVFTQTIQFLNPCFLMLPYIIGVYALKEGENEKCHIL